MAKRFKPSRKSIVLQTIRDHRISETEFFGKRRSRHLVEARVDAMHRLFADGAYRYEIAKHLKRNYTFIRYHLSQHDRLSRAQYHRDRYYQRKSQECLIDA